MTDLIITISIPDEGDTVTLVSRKGDLGAFQNVPRLDFDELIDAANNMLADMIANPPNIPEPPQPERYTPAPKINVEEEAAKLLPEVRQAVIEWDFSKFKITVKNMAAYLKSVPKPSEKVVERALEKLASEGVIHKGRYNQYALPPPPDPPSLFDLLDEDVEPAE